MTQLDDMTGVDMTGWRGVKGKAHLPMEEPGRSGMTWGAAESIESPSGGPWGESTLAGGASLMTRERIRVRVRDRVRVGAGGG